MTPEQARLLQAKQDGDSWRQWGPYLSERQWGTVREDYSENGDAWNYFSHDQARSRAYRWGEDGLAGISDDQQQLCFALAFWNGRDAILKERLFGLTNSEGNHGEDVKEYYYYLDCTPTHSYMKWLYKYPQAPFPYADLVETKPEAGTSCTLIEQAVGCRAVPARRASRSARSRGPGGSLGTLCEQERQGRRPFALSACSAPLVRQGRLVRPSDLDCGAGQRPTGGCPASRQAWQRRMP